jgi:hypothetical protein
MGPVIACRESLPRVVIPHPNAITSTTTNPSANNLTTIFTRRSLGWLASGRLAFSSCVELTPKRGTHGDEWAMNLRERQSLEAYSPKSVEVESCELQLHGVLKSSHGPGPMCRGTMLRTKHYLVWPSGEW